MNQLIPRHRRAPRFFNPGRGPPPRPPARRPPARRLPVILFVATCFSTIYAGSSQFDVDPATNDVYKVLAKDPKTGETREVVDWGRILVNGLTYAAGVMVMLGFHEMGHYLQARRYHVPASLPMFIPMPFSFIGTMGAVIVQRAGVADRKAMFDIAISGPLAGLAIAVPLSWWGIAHSHIESVDSSQIGYTDPLLIKWMIGWILQPLQAGEDIRSNPIQFAGWVGFFITALNLIPIGQLDGGHILYCLLGKKSYFAARGLYLGAITFVVVQMLRGRTEYALFWTLMLVLIGLMGRVTRPRRTTMCRSAFRGSYWAG